MLISCSTWKSFFMWRVTSSRRRSIRVVRLLSFYHDAVIVWGDFAESPSFSSKSYNSVEKVRIEWKS